MLDRNIILEAVKQRMTSTAPSTGRWSGIGILGTPDGSLLQQRMIRREYPDPGFGAREGVNG